MTKNSEHKPDQCPRCGQTNCCYNLMKGQPVNESVAEGGDTQSCWCMQVKLTSEQRQEVSQYGDGQCCLCQSCLEEIKKNH